jgi:uncharacterized protein YneF (UPF0154 family)
MADDEKKVETDEEPEVDETKDDQTADQAEDEKAEDTSDDKADDEEADGVKSKVTPAKKKPSKANKPVKSSKDDIPARAASKVTRQKKVVSMPVAIIVAVACVVVGALLGYFVIGNLTSNQVSGKTTLTEDQLDTTVGTYTYNGKSYTISARDAITSSSSLDSAKNDDGTYNMPSASTILSKAQNGILSLEVEAQGIEVTDDDISSYATSTLNTDDYSSIASQYSLDEDSVKDILRQSCGVKKLYDQVVTTTVTTSPTAPTAPSDGNNDEATADYGAYIVNLLGDEWDSTNNTWARTDGPFYSSMSSMQFTSDSATYPQAETAYYVAYQQYSQSSSNASTQWTDYVNGLLSKASITIDSLVS